MPYDFQSLLENLASASPQAAAAIQQRKNIAETIRERLFNESLASQQNDRANQEWQARQAETTYQHGRDTIADQQAADAKAQRQTAADQASHNQYLSGAASGDLMEVTPPSGASQALGSQLGPQATLPSNPSSSGNPSGTPSAVGPRASMNPNASNPDVLSMLMFPNQPSNPISAGPTSPTTTDMGASGGTTFNANDFYQDPVTKKYYRNATPQEKQTTTLNAKKSIAADFATNNPDLSRADQLNVQNHIIYGMPLDEKSTDKLKVHYYETLNDKTSTPQERAQAQAGLTKIQQDEIAAKKAEHAGTEPGTWQLMEGADGKPVLFNSKTAEVRPAPAGGIQKPGVQKDILKAYQPAMDSGERYNVMAKNYEDATQNHDQQAMLSLLANHLGMTMGLQKGARLTKDIIQEAQQSRPWLQGLAAKFDSNGYLSGVNLTQGQMDQMVNLGRERFSEDVTKAHSAAQYLGATDDGPARIPGAATVRRYVALAGGDPKKAKQLAAADGWTIK
jgi:hypothetical protein